MLNRISGRPLLFATAMLLLTATFFVFTGSSSARTATLHFDRTVSIYEGSEVRVMGVKIGQVTSVVPQGDQVKVEIEYDDQYKLPAGAKAAIVTPTLVADRFVQVVPAYTGGPALKDGGEIALADTATPVELDEIYRSLSDLTVALGPNGANKDGALNTLLSAGAKALEGNGALGNATLKNLSAAVETFGDNRGPLFASVRNLSQVTRALSANDQFVSAFMSDLSSVSAQLADDRGQLAKALAALARAIGTVETFVRDNREAVVSDVEDLTTILKVLAKEEKSLNEISRFGALGLSNLTLAFDVKTGTIGSRVQFTPTFYGIDGVLCDIVVNSGNLPASQAETVCALLKQITEPLKDQLPEMGFPGSPSRATMPGVSSSKPPTSLKGLLGALTEANSR